ncbi:MAG: endolytic transglycosylase MltG [Rickettsiales bacterium]|nr:endolytic transglycosylase MltG [Rickettsiales bacterium]
MKKKTSKKKFPANTKKSPSLVSRSKFHAKGGGVSGVAGRGGSTLLNFRNTISQIAIAVIVVLGLIISYATFILSPIRVKSELVVAPGASVSRISSDLKSNGLIISEYLFKASVMAWGGRVQVGTYDLKPGRSVWGVARDLGRGNIATTTLTIPEGLTAKQIYEIVGMNPELSGEIRVVYNDGELFPDTYAFARGTNRNKVLETLAAKMARVREINGVNFPAPIKDWNELLSLAALVQKETSILAEMPRVAGVYINRLKIDQRLQADPTVVYAVTNGLGHMQGRGITRAHLQFDSPYNTYKYKGLPPRPIANPGLDAIRAAMRPEKHKFYYFVADGTGGHVFAETHEEHQENHANWRLIRECKAHGLPSDCLMNQ